MASPLLRLSRWPGWPRWAGSIRFRLTALYSVVLFGLAAVVVGGIYAALARELDDQPVSRTEQWIGYRPTPRGVEIGVFETETIDVLATFEQAVNSRALEQLRTYTFAALALLFAASLAVGWFVSGRVLRPIGRIASVARDIQATDLSRRISLDGPDDELKRLADTFDQMLGRIDDAFESQRRFIQEASHELRNPLAVIRTNVDVALSDPDPSPHDLRRAAEVVAGSAARMSTLVDDLVVYARHGTRPDRREPVDLRKLAAELTGEFSAPAEARRRGGSRPAPRRWTPPPGSGPSRGRSRRRRPARRRRKRRPAAPGLRRRPMPPSSPGAEGRRGDRWGRSVPPRRGQAPRRGLTEGAAPRRAAAPERERRTGSDSRRKRCSWPQGRPAGRKPG